MRVRALSSWFFLLAVASLIQFPATAREKDTADAKYKALVEQLKGGDTSVDFAELRADYASSSDYEWETDSDLQKQMYSALDSKDYSQATKVAEKALEGDYLDIDAHQVLALAYRESGEQDKAKFHQAVVHGLIQAIFNSGDGKAEETAYVVNSTREEYIIMMVIGLRLGVQALKQGGTHQFDVMECTNPKTQEKVTLYFNIDRPMAAMAKALK